MSKTINRGSLKKGIIKGEYVVKCDGIYTDDYAYDNEVNFHKTDFMPATYFPSFWLWLEENLPAHNYHLNDQDTKSRIMKQYRDARDVVEKKGMVFEEGDFRGYGRAYQDDEGFVHLSFGYKSYTFKKT